MTTPTPQQRVLGPRGPRAPNSVSSFVAPPPPPPLLTTPAVPASDQPNQWAPLNLQKKKAAPKLKLPPLVTSASAPDVAPKNPDDYSYYGSLPAAAATTANANDRTLRPPMPGGPLDETNKLRKTLEDIHAASRDRSRERENDSRRPSLDDHSSNSPSAEEEFPIAGYDDERFSDSVLQPLDRLGEGAGGAVYKVRDKRSGEIYARKTIPTRTTPANQLITELRHLAGTKHENICKFYGAYMSSSCSELNVIMELCEGGSLEAITRTLRQRNGRTSEPIMGKLAEGILKGLVHLHQKRMIHRDIKPSNILLTLSGIVKLCDFGVSGNLDESSMVQTFTGTSLYMAPERVNGQKYTVRADVWSTGLSLLELAQNRFPLPDDLDGIIDLMDYITRGPPIQLQDDNDVKWSPEMKDFISQCLKPNPVDRPQPHTLLKHEWIVKHGTTVKDKNVSRWVCGIWGVEYKSKSKKSKVSRPVSRQDPGPGPTSANGNGDNAQPTSHDSGDVPPWEQ